MPPRSKIETLPPTVRTELERRIVERAFGGYRDLAEWLQSQGYHIAHDSVRRYGSRLQQQIEALEQLAGETRASTQAADRASDNLINLAIQLTHHKVLSMLPHPEQGQGSVKTDSVAAEPPTDGGDASRAGTGAGCQDITGSAPTAGQKEERSEDSSRGGADAGTPGSGADMAGLDLADLGRLTRAVGELNRITIARRREAEKSSSRRTSRQSGAHAEHTEPMRKGLSPEGEQALRDALLGVRPFEESAREIMAARRAAKAASPPADPFDEGDKDPFDGGDKP
jgi:hypothetical protein